MGGFGEGAAWSLLNLIMSIIALLCAVILIVTLLGKRRGQEDDDEYNEALTREEITAEENRQERRERRRLARLKVPAIIAGFIPGILFLILENVRLPVVWITQWTPLIGAAFIAAMALVVVQAVVKKRDKANKGDEEHDYTAGMGAGTSEW
jgi:hypothetical protein